MMLLGGRPRLRGFFVLLVFSADEDVEALVFIETFAGFSSSLSLETGRCHDIILFRV